jgi:hypothetical protein
MVPTDAPLHRSDRTADDRRGREPTAAPASTGATDAPFTYSEDVHLRNYDDRAYRFTLVASDGNEACFRREYRLAPGEFRSECNLLDPAMYDVRVELDTGPADAATCAVGTGPAHTVCIEVGNNVVAVSEGTD